jgi:hypothetical protein
MAIPFKRFAGALLFTCIAASQAHATVITFSSAGTIYGGQDPLNIFHLGLDLTGKAYTQSVTIDTSFLSVWEVSPGFNSLYATWAPIRVQGEVNIEGHTYSWQTESGNGSAIMWNSVARRNYPFNFMHVGGYGVNTLDGNVVMGFAEYGSETVPFLDDVDFAQRLYFDGLTGYGAVAALSIWSGDGTETNFGGTPEWVRWEAANAVPEPATLGMLLLGLGLAAARQYRRPKRAA